MTGWAELTGSFSVFLRTCQAASEATPILFWAQEIGDWAKPRERTERRRTGRVFVFDETLEFCALRKTPRLKARQRLESRSKP
jgi:hypothetical protein